MNSFKENVVADCFNIIKILFWISSDRIKSEEFTDYLESLFLPPWIDNFEVRAFQEKEPLSKVVNDVFAAINSRHRQVHVLLIGDKETDSDKTMGHKIFMRAVTEISEEFAALEHHLIVCNVTPNLKDFHTVFHKSVLSEVTIGLQVILSVEMFATNLHFVDFQEWLLDQKREMIEEEFYDKNSSALNKKGIQKAINELLEICVKIAKM